MPEVSDRLVVGLEVGISPIYPACVATRFMARKINVHPEVDSSDTCIARMLMGEINGWDSM